MRSRIRLQTTLNLALILLAAAAFVVLVARGEPPRGVELEVRLPAPGVDDLRVYVSGAVLEPGVVTLAPGARVADAIALAGGAAPDGELAAVNLARRVVDEDHVHVPGKGEVAVLLDLNDATGDELELLPGVGPVRAAQIIDERTRQPFASTDELVERGILPASTYEQLRDLVTVPVGAVP